MEFLTHQFKEVGRKPATIRTYKSALEQPIRLGFNVHLREDIFANLVRAMALQAPAERVPTISWSLNKALSLLATPEYSGPDASHSNLLCRAIFLVTLACGARVSKVSAVRRGRTHIIQKDNGRLLLSCRGFS